ncbi:GOLPH3/VPS74 family protein [Streptomyces sp. NBC_01264]|uniref:GOLPH3/VPS74 family protein n=1 Tax=Streptomyces sp. NBC_01264 TaxID=2903804 RepID=UPI00225480D4|nr:GPP34 family phosphoprotein [Streptomyces sp. NBC_01264]MCX4781946.1 GPP34 family phosphoprotein [Streptomyces sp. NBC_01264]
MTTPRDLLIISMDAESGRTAEQGELSLALAGAEVVDLLAAGAVGLDGDDIVPTPGEPAALVDPLLDAAAASLVREAPYESVTDWLWRRGLGLSANYQAVLEEDGQLVRRRRRGFSLRAGELVPADSPARGRAEERWTSREPVLVLLTEALGGGTDRGADAPDVADDAVATVLAAVNDAVTELAGVRQRRAIENAAFDNIWRATGG